MEILRIAVYWICKDCPASEISIPNIAMRHFAYGSDQRNGAGYLLMKSISSRNKSLKGSCPEESVAPARQDDTSLVHTAALRRASLVIICIL